MVSNLLHGKTGTFTSCSDQAWCPAVSVTVSQMKFTEIYSNDQGNGLERRGDILAGENSITEPLKLEVIFLNLSLFL